MLAVPPGMLALRELWVAGSQCAMQDGVPVGVGGMLAYLDVRDSPQ